MLRLLRVDVVAMTTIGQSEQLSSMSVIADVNIADTRASATNDIQESKLNQFIYQYIQTKTNVINKTNLCIT